MSQDPSPKLDDRSHKLLKSLIELYIESGQPVGSRTLSRDSGVDLSPATVRNIMMDLEEMGLVKAPHTSAGRMPTELGYRVFINTMLNIKPLDDLAVAELKKQLNPEFSSKMLIKSASTILSDVTRLAGVVMVPKHDLHAVQHVEFLPLSNRRVLAILVLSDKEVQNRIISTDRNYSDSELQQAANYVNTHFLGHDFTSMREMLKNELHSAQQELSGMMKLVVEMSGKVFVDDTLEQDEELVVEGQTNLMSFDDLSDMEKLKQLFEAFHKKRDILHLLDRCQQARGVQIFVGQESGYEVFGDCSVVTSHYSVSGEIVGVLGVVGPTRMAYDRVIPIVDITARLLSAALGQDH